MVSNLESVSYFCSNKLRLYIPEYFGFKPRTKTVPKPIEAVAEKAIEKVEKDATSVAPLAISPQSVEKVAEKVINKVEKDAVAPLVIAQKGVEKAVEKAAKNVEKKKSSVGLLSSEYEFDRLKESSNFFI